jgi:hypothetical protein
MAARNWLNRHGRAQQGSTLILVLGLAAFCTTLGLILLRSAHAREELAHERYAYRKAMTVLESLTRCACRAEAQSWKKRMEDSPTKHDLASLTLVIDSIVYALNVSADKGDCLVRASCKSVRGDTVVLETHLAWEGEQAVIREQKRSS